MYNYWFHDVSLNKVTLEQKSLNILSVHIKSGIFIEKLIILQKKKDKYILKQLKGDNG